MCHLLRAREPAIIAQNAGPATRARPGRTAHAAVARRSDASSDSSYRGTTRAPIDSSAAAREHLACPQSCRMPPLKAFIVQDSPVIRENLVAALEELVPLVVVGSADDEAGAVGWLTDARNACDIAIVDIFLRSGS